MVHAILAVHAVAETVTSPDSHDRMDLTPRIAHLGKIL
jgi:hypothetical protein